MVALHVQHAFHALGIGKRRRVQESQIIFRPLLRMLLQPMQTIRRMQFVLAALESVGLQIVTRPLQIGVGQIDADAAARILKAMACNDTA